MAGPLSGPAGDHNDGRRGSADRYRGSGPGAVLELGLVRGHQHAGRRYPPPGGIYTGFTNCPVKNPLMSQSNSFTACTLGLATSGSIKIGNIVTPVTEPVNVQFGFYENTQQTYYADAVPPLAGTNAILSTKPDLIPQSLTTELGGPSSNATVQNVCQQAAANPALNKVYALAEEAGPITNFNLLSWTQPVMFKLINPLLGSGCTIGTLGNPVMLNPQLSVGPGGQLTLTNDPNPARNPDTFVLAITQATAGDNTFSAPGVTNCGPGGVANLDVGAALDAGAGLPWDQGTASRSTAASRSLPPRRPATRPCPSRLTMPPSCCARSSTAPGTSTARRSLWRSSSSC
jgi:hypothetical protein